MIERFNYKKNVTIDPGKGTLNGQGKGALATCRYGFFPMSYNGCEIIALYNIRYLLGIPEELCNIAKEVYPYGHAFCGVFGTWPFAIGKYLKDNHIPYIYDKEYGDFSKTFSSGKYAVITFWNAHHPFKGIHTVAIENVPEGVKVYNKTNSATEPVVVESLDGYMDAKRFICGYTVKNSSK